MKIANSFGLLSDFAYAFRTAFIPTLCAIARSPGLLLHPAEISRTFFQCVWSVFGDVTDEAGRGVKNELITPNAHGIVMDIGAGHGHTINYLDRAKVTKYVALEPNALMHPVIRKRANDAGYTEDDSSLLILPYGVQDIEHICTALGDKEAVDAIVSILTLCSVGSPERTVKDLVDNILKPGGTLLFYEHVLNPHDDVAWWQRFWAPMWQVAFDGCRMDRPTHLWIYAMSEWETRELWGKEGEDVESLFWHSVGKFVKKLKY